MGLTLYGWGRGIRNERPEAIFEQIIANIGELEYKWQFVEDFWNLNLDY